MLAVNKQLGMTSSSSTLHLEASNNVTHRSLSSSTPFLTHEKASTSLNDLDIVRKIVEREGCIEALSQLLTSHSRGETEGTLASAPLVVQSLLEQLRSVSVHIVESIEKWRQVNQTGVFQWRNLNYLVKMIHDLDFLAAHKASLEHLDVFRGLRLCRNPFLTSVHLDHDALLEDTPETACRICNAAGLTDMRRIFWSSQTLLREERGVGAESCTNVTPPDHSSHQEVKVSLGEPHPKSSKERRPHSSGKVRIRPLGEPQDAMYDLQLSTELLFQHEHELGALKEELALLQRKVEDDMTPPSKRLQTRIAALNNQIKLKTGDFFHRRNELLRKEAELRLGAKKRDARIVQRNRLMDSVESLEPSPEQTLNGEPQYTGDDLYSDSEVFRMALQDDELRRQDLVERFATHAKMKAAITSTKLKLHQMGSPHPYSPSSSQSQLLFKAPSSPAKQSAPIPIAELSLEQMTTTDVSHFVSSLNLGDDSLYGSMLKACGIDGPLLARATDSDLDELGIVIRLHRVKILDAVDSLRQQQAGRR